MWKARALYQGRGRLPFTLTRSCTCSLNAMAQDQRAAQGRRDPRQEQDDYLNMLTLAGSEVYSLLSRIRAIDLGSSCSVTRRFGATQLCLLHTCTRIHLHTCFGAMRPCLSQQLRMSSDTITEAADHNPEDIGTLTRSTTSTYPLSQSGPTSILAMLD
jgi:hypothetical protein